MIRTQFVYLLVNLKRGRIHNIFALGGLVGIYVRIDLQELSGIDVGLLAGINLRNLAGLGNNRRGLGGTGLDLRVHEG